MRILLAAAITLAFGLVAARAADEKFLLGVPESGGKWIWGHDALGQLILAAGEKAVDAIDSPVAAREFAALMEQAEALIAAEHGPQSRMMATFLSETLAMGWGILSDADILARGQRAIAIERMLNANYIFWGDFAGRFADPIETIAVGHVLDALYEEYPERSPAASNEFKAIAFQAAQNAFVTKGSRAAIRRLRLDPAIPESQRIENEGAFTAAHWIEAYADFEEWTEAGLFGDPGTPEREQADAAVARQNGLAEQAGLIFLQQQVDMGAIFFPRAVSYEELASRLRPDEVLLLVTPGSLYIHIFLATDRGIEWQVSEADILDFYDRIDALRAAMGIPAGRGAVPLTQDAPTDDAAVVENARWLFRQLVDPVGTSLARKSRLMVAATDSLAAFPFEALIASDPPAGARLGEVDWLVRHHSVNVLPAVELMLARDDEPLALGAVRYLGFGAPDYQPSPEMGAGSTVTQMVATLPPLPEAADEVRDVAAALPEAATYILLGRDANELRLKYLADSGELATYNVVHFATHGLTPGDNDDALDPALALSPMVDMGPISFDASFYYRLSPSGLLTDIEISTMKFAADLVVLSACNSGAPSPDSPEAYSGLAAAFLGSGAERVLVSHWPVDSRAAVEIVTATLRNGLASGDLAEAQRQAVLALIAKGGDSAHPRYWAPFSLYGTP